MKRVNPILLLIIFSVLVFLLRKIFFPEYSDEMVITAMEAVLARLGVMSYVYVLAAYVLCAFFFIPVLMPLNILCGAFFGPVTGFLVALAGVTLGSIATTYSVRNVFRGMGGVVMNNPEYKHLLNQLTRYGVIVVLIVRMAFVVPYILQNILLAMTNISMGRMTLLTLVGAIPGALSYSFIGAGLVNLEDANLYGLFLLIPVILLYGVNWLIGRLQKKHGLKVDEIPTGDNS